LNLGKLINEIKMIGIGNNLFLIGIFFLASAPSLAIIFIISSFIVNKKNNLKNILKDRWNLPLLISSLLMIISAIYHSISVNKLSYNWDFSLSWLGLFNWLPLFCFFGGSQAYLENNYQRRLCAYSLISGSIPVLITGIFQYFFGWHGPYQLLYGFIKWYQKPIIDPAGLSGLFSNANYAGAWLNIIWPFSIATTIQRNNFIRKTTILSIFCGILTCLVLSNSRAAWGGLIISIILVFGIKTIRLIFPIFIIISSAILICIRPIFGIYLQNILRDIIPQKIWMEFTSAGFEGLDTSRLKIWGSALNYISENPIFGSGAGSFTSRFISETGFYKGHSHNLILELAVSYGLPAAISILIFLIYILFNSSRKIKLFKELEDQNIDYFERAWITSFIVLLISNMVDVQYLDIRISLAFWIILAGMKNIISVNK